MSGVTVQPAPLVGAAAQVAGIGSAVEQAVASAAGATTGVVAAAQDEVSLLIAEFFGAFGRDGQLLLAQAGLINEQFARLLAEAASAYTQAETQAAGMLGALSAPGAVLSPLLGQGPVYQTIATLGGQVDSLLYMSGSGTATPEVAGEVPPFIPNVTKLFLDDFTFSGRYPERLHQIAVSTASGLYPFTGTKDLVLDTSLLRGINELNNAIHLVLTPDVGVGNIGVLGYSQSAVVASLAMPDLALHYGPTQIQFNLLGDPSNPNGGLLARFPGLSFPSLGVTLGAATPSNLFVTNIYSLEYDGFADFPRYPINVLADINALAGIIFVHPHYQYLTPPLGEGYLLEGSRSLGSIHSLTDYYVIPTPNLPILEPLRAIPLLGNPLADLVQPDLRALINWGYGDPNYGFSTTPADVPTPFGLAPPLSATLALGPALAHGTPAGINAFTNGLRALIPTAPPAISATGLLDNLTGGHTLPALPPPTSIPSALISLLTGVTGANNAVVATLTSDISTAYSVLQPTADIATALFVSLPSYDLDLFANGLIQAINGQPLQGLAHAFGDPIAATTGGTTLLLGFEAITVRNALDTLLTGKPNPIPH